jgi:hypothetical protein
MSKKSTHNGHSYTFTHLNDMDYDKFSDMSYANVSKENIHAPKYRHSKSPSKERHIEHNNTSYA